MTRRRCYGDISVSSDNLNKHMLLMQRMRLLMHRLRLLMHRLRCLMHRLRWEVRISVASIMLDRGIGTNTRRMVYRMEWRMERRVEWRLEWGMECRTAWDWRMERILRGGTVKHLGPLMSWAWSWTVWWLKNMWGCSWMGVTRVRSSRKTLPSGRASVWTMTFWSFDSCLGPYRRCIRNTALLTGTMPLAMLAPTRMTRGHVTLRCRIEFRLCLSSGERCEWITRWTYLSFIDPSLNAFLSGQVPLNGIGWIVVFCHIRIID